MCYNCAEKDREIQAIKSLLDVDGQHWVLILNKSNRMETIPAKSYGKVKADVELLFTPKPLPEEKEIINESKTNKK